MLVMSWKMVSTAWLCVLVTSLVAASEVSNENPPEDDNYAFEEQNYIDPIAQSLLLDPVDVGVQRKLRLQNMLYNQMNQGVPPNMPAGPNWRSVEVVDSILSDPVDIPVMNFIKKRLAENRSVVPKVKVIAKPPIQKWKNKKERVGSHIICYFKLCSISP